jgi:hypothetical protein
MSCYQISGNGTEKLKLPQADLQVLEKMGFLDGYPYRAGATMNLIDAVSAMTTADSVVKLRLFKFEVRQIWGVKNSALEPSKGILTISLDSTMESGGKSLTLSLPLLPTLASSFLRLFCDLKFSFSHLGFAFPMVTAFVKPIDRFVRSGREVFRFFGCLGHKSLSLNGARNCGIKTFFGRSVGSFF